MKSFRITATDYLVPALAGQAGSYYESPPQSEQQARALARILLDLSAPPCGDGPWRHARAGGSRIVTLELVGERVEQ